MAETPIGGPVVMAYVDRDSVRPGESIKVMVSAEGVSSVDIDVLRLRCCATPASGPGFRANEVAVDGTGRFQVRVQEIDIGSYGIVERWSERATHERLTLQAYVWPTLPGPRSQAILSSWNVSAQAGIALGLDASGHLAFWIGDGTGPVETGRLSAPIGLHRWSLIALIFDGPAGTATLIQEPAPAPGVSIDQPQRLEAPVRARSVFATGPLMFGAWNAGTAERPRPKACFNGKIDRPRVSSAALGKAAIFDSAVPGLTSTGRPDLLAAWDFSIGIPTQRAHDLSAWGRHARLVNLPARAATGANWSGRSISWKEAPAEYGAIHFHDDDLYDAGWTPTTTLTIPAALSSGVHTVRVRADGAEFYVPFYVRRALDAPPAKVAYLASTATYLAYANYRGRIASPLTDVRQGRLTVLDRTDLLVLTHPQIGISTYDAHRDGSAVHYSSRLRPVTNCRPVGGDIEIAFDNFAPDLLVVDWLEHIDVPYEVLTDEDLHKEGLAALDGVRVLVTGTHPEYHSREMMDALDAFVVGGGRLLCMGGNVFLWKVEIHPGLPGMIELRRSESRLRRWNPGPGQGHHAFSGEYGGYWRNVARPSNLLAGVGMTSQGFDISSYYRRQVDAANARVAFIFDGVKEEILGDFGLLRGGAAGVEVDQADVTRGTPRHALVLASSENHSNVFEPSEEVVPLGAAEMPAKPANRADIVFFEAPGGGAVFTSGSIAFAGSLSHESYANPIARITSNVLKRFLDPTPFSLPGP